MEIKFISRNSNHPALSGRDAELRVDMAPNDTIKVAIHDTDYTGSKSPGFTIKNDRLGALIIFDDGSEVLLRQTGAVHFLHTKNS